MGTIGTNVGMHTLLYKKGIAKFCNAPTAKCFAPILPNCSLRKLYICMSGVYRMAISKYFGLIGPVVNENAP